MDPNTNPIDYSVVIPVYNSEKTLSELVSRLQSEFKKLDKSYELIFVDDCSQDNSWPVLKQLHKDSFKFKNNPFTKKFWTT